MVDVGVNYGYFSLLWAAQKPGNRVIAFEASPRNQPLLRGNIQRNGLTDFISLRTEAAGKEVGRYLSRKQWQTLIGSAGGTVETFHDSVAIYPWPLSMVFGRSLHCLYSIRPPSSVD